MLIVSRFFAATMMTPSINKDYMDIDEFLASTELSDGLYFPENDFTDDDKKNKEHSNPGKARTSTWQVSKSPDKKVVSTSVEIEGVSYAYKLLPTSKRKKKQRKQSVPGDKKDGKYWDRRVKNNKAAKRSRDLRRQKEMTVASKAVNLEVVNEELRNEVTKLREQVKMLNKKLEEKSKE